MSDSKSTNAKKTSQKKRNNKVNLNSKKPTVLSGRPWDDIEVHVAEPKSRGVLPPDVQREQNRIIAVVVYASIGLFFLFGLYALATGDRSMMWFILATVRILLFCSIGAVAGPALLHFILEKFQHHG